MKMNDELAAKLKYLHLGGLMNRWSDHLKLAAQKNFSHSRLLTYVVEQEYRLKQENALKLRLKRARIPEPLAIETFPFTKQPKLNKKKIMALYDTLDYMEKKQNIIWVGPTGTGKTGMATSFLTHAINQGYSGRYVHFADLIAELFASAADHSEEKVLKKYLRCDCLHVDEIGYIQVEPAQVGLFFTLMQNRHKKKTTLITSNLGFSQWDSFLNNAYLTAALVDRLTESSHVINMKKCVSLRPPLSSVS